MDFKELQNTQGKLDEKFLAEEPDMSAEERFNKTLVALSVTVARVADCAEHFKLGEGSKGKVDSDRFYCIPQTIREGENVVPKYADLRKRYVSILSFEQAHHLTLVEKCSEALRFILSLANQMNEELLAIVERQDVLSKEEWYLEIIADLRNMNNPRNNAWRALRDLNIDFYHYYTSLGITHEELEQACHARYKRDYDRLKKEQ